MGGRGIVRAVLLAATLVAGLGAGAAQAQEDHSYYGPRLIEERVRLAAPSGRTIAATALRAEGQGPFGAVILNHGVSASARERARESSDLLINAAAVFARRGYVVVMPLRRGFGATGGEMAEDPGSCSNPDYRSAEANAADDVMAAYDYARSLPYVDGNRMILAGQSAGGMVELAGVGGDVPRPPRLPFRPPRRHRAGPRGAARPRSGAQYQDRRLQEPLSRLPRGAGSARRRGERRRALRLRRRPAGRARRGDEAVRQRRQVELHALRGR